MTTPTTHNQPEYTVSELSGAVKRSIETTFGYVRVRGEISGFKRAASGHCYMDLKDDKAALNAVCWKGQAAKLAMRPQDGLEVIATGRMTTYPGRSNYQLVIERMEAAGEGALMALLEQRKKALAAEGLFAAERKQALPYLPQVIGVVTSPTGAVIRDILHRISERFPVHVLVWPTIVQGKGAEDKITAAIEGFNRFDGMRTPPRPDVLIVARGGGSIEDLWCFNEENVVRAANASQIPLISAVGHETDTTLIDYVSDKRAPTPTAAAEIAVPVLYDLRSTLLHMQHLLAQGAGRAVEHRAQRLEAVSRGLIDPRRMLEMKAQRLDEWSDRLQNAVSSQFDISARRLDSIRLSHVRLVQMVAAKQERITDRTSRLDVCLPTVLARHTERASMLASRLQSARTTERLIAQGTDTLIRYDRQCRKAIGQRIVQTQQRLDNAARMMDALGHHNVLKRGFAYVTTSKGKVIASASAQQYAMQVHFHDGVVDVTAKATSSPKKRMADASQGSLL